MTPVVKLKPGDVIFTHTPRSIISWLIRYWGKSYWNHVMLVTEVGEGVKVAESVASGVREVGLYEAIKPNEIVGIKRPEYDGVDSAIQKARDLVGRPYGFFDILQIFVWEVTGRWYRPWKTKAIICSELVGMALAEGGVFIYPENQTVWTPKDLWDGLKETVLPPKKMDSLIFLV